MQNARSQKVAGGVRDGVNDTTVKAKDFKVKANQ